MAILTDVLTAVVKQYFHSSVGARQPNPLVPWAHPCPCRKRFRCSPRPKRVTTLVRMLHDTTIVAIVVSYNYCCMIQLLLYDTTIVTNVSSSLPTLSRAIFVQNEKAGKIRRMPLTSPGQLSFPPRTQFKTCSHPSPN